MGAASRADAELHVPFDGGGPTAVILQGGARLEINMLDFAAAAKNTAAHVLRMRDIFNHARAMLLSVATCAGACASKTVVRHVAAREQDERTYLTMMSAERLANDHALEIAFGCLMPCGDHCNLRMCGGTDVREDGFPHDFTVSRATLDEVIPHLDDLQLNDVFNPS